MTLTVKTRLGAMLSATLLAMLAAAPLTYGEDATHDDALSAGFRDPPNSARPRVWWHWMNGNITKDGIRKDLEWMHRVGIGGLQNFDANLVTPKIVEQRLVYMTPEWKDAFRYAAGLADNLGLELAIASSPGWSETGGPWVQPKDGLKKLVWSETTIAGGKRFTGKLPAPPSVTGPFQALTSGSDPLASSRGTEKKPTYYADSVVLAYPLTNNNSVVAPQVTTLDGKAVDIAQLQDGNARTAVTVPRGTVEQPGGLLITYPAAQTIRSANVYVLGKTTFGDIGVAPRLEANVDGTWHQVADVAVSTVPTTTSFAPVTAQRFRLLLAPSTAVGAVLGEPAPGAAGGEGLMGMRGAPSSPIRIAELSLSSEAKVDRFESKAGFAIEQDYYALSTAANAELQGIDPKTVLNLSSRMQADGSLDWTPPKGKWRVLRLGYSLLGTTNHPATAEATGLEVDKFDGPAVRNYLETYLNMYRDAAGAELIGARGVRALLTDSIEVGAANWTPKIIEQFTRLRGYDPTPWLPALTGEVIGSRSQSDAFLYDYRRTLADLMSSEHYGTAAAVAHEHGLKVYGEALEDHRPSLGDDMTMRSHTDVPMAAMWTYSRKSGPKPTYLADIKGAASVAHLYGQNLVAAESMTSAMQPWAYAPNELRRVIDLEFVTGVNRPVIHTSVHQPLDDKQPGLSLFIFGQYFNRHETWAEMAKPWVDYLSRNGYLLQQGRSSADVAYFYGEEAPLTGLFGDRRVTDAPTQYAYDFVNVDALLNLLRVDNGELVADSGARYKVLYLGGSSQRMTLSVLQRIADLADAGATIVGEAPQSSPSLNNDAATFNKLIQRLWSGQAVTKVGKGQVIAGTDVEAALSSLNIVPDFSYRKSQADSEVLFTHRHLSDGELYLINNRQNRGEQFEAKFRVTGKVPEIWHADSGTVEAVSYRVEGGQTIVPLEMNAEDSFFVVFRKPSNATSFTAPKATPVVAATLDGAWSVTLQPKLGDAMNITLPALSSLSEQTDPAVKYFSGTAIYKKQFTLPKGTQPNSLWLDLGKVGELADVYVNGKLVGNTWHAPYRVAIGSAVKRGKNELEIRVANLWVNRLIGDAQPGANKTTFTSMPSYRADAPLRPSGLMGPVTLLKAQ